MPQLEKRRGMHGVLNLYKTKKKYIGYGLLYMGRPSATTQGGGGVYKLTLSPRYLLWRLLGNLWPGIRAVLFVIDPSVLKRVQQRQQINKSFN